MGWSSSADPMAQVKLTFDSKEDAQAYAKKNGWKFETRMPVALANQNIEAGTHNYGHNFLTRRVELELAEAKEAGIKVCDNAEFQHPGEHQSGWFMQLTYHGDGEIEQYGERKQQNTRNSSPQQKQ